MLFLFGENQLAVFGFPSARFTASQGIEAILEWELGKWRPGHTAVAAPPFGRRILWARRRI